MKQIEATRCSLSTIEAGTLFYINGLKFVCVCKSHPEAYEVYENDNEIAYVRVRNGVISCSVGAPNNFVGSYVYCADVNWGYAGEFKSGRQRIKHLNKIANILKQGGNYEVY